MKNALAQADHAVETLRAQRQDHYYPRFHLAPAAGCSAAKFSGLLCGEFWTV